MSYPIYVDLLNKELDVSSIRNLLVRNSALADIIDIHVPRIYEGIDISEKTFVIKTMNDKGVYYEKVLAKAVTGDYVILKWLVTREFTVYNGELRISILIADPEGFRFLTREASIPVADSVTLEQQLADIDVLESYLSEIRFSADEVERDRAEALESKNIAVSAKDEAVTAKDLAVPASVTAVEAKDIAVTASVTAVEAKDTAIEAKNIAVEAKDTAVDAKNIAVTAKNIAVEAKDIAVPASVAAVEAKDIAESAKSTAVNASITAVTAKDEAVSASVTAVDAKTAAEAARDAAALSQADALASKDAAAASQSAAETAKTGAESARDIAVTAADEAVAIAVQVETNTLAIGQNTSDLAAHKEEYTNQVEFPITNLVTNGDFSNGTTGWVLPNFTLENGKIYTTLADYNTSNYQSLNNLISGHKYYISAENTLISGSKSSGANTATMVFMTSGTTLKTNIEFTRVDVSGNIVSGVLDIPLKKSLIFTSDGTENRINLARTIGSVFANTKYYWDNLQLINLTQTFGAGNEPTKEEMDELMTYFPNSWFDGTVNLANHKWFMTYMLKKFREKANIKQEEWITPTLLNGWFGNIKYRKNEFGRVEFKGYLQSQQGTGTIPFTLLTGYAPLQELWVKGTSNDLKDFSFKVSGGTSQLIIYKTTSSIFPFDNFSFIAGGA